MAFSAAGGGLELDPCRRDTVGFVGRLGGAEAGRVGLVETLAEHVLDAVTALDGLEVPREGDQVAPKAVDGELGGDAVEVAGSERCLEVRQPCIDAFLWGLEFRGCRRFHGLGHAYSLVVRVRAVTQHTPFRLLGRELQWVARDVAHAGLDA